MPKFVYCSDLHLTSRLPRCRKQTQSEWIEDQKQNLNLLSIHADKLKCPIVIGGDLFDETSNPEYLKSMFTNAFKNNDVYAIAGQHELPWHQWNKVDESSFGVLWNTGFIKPISFGKYAHYGQPIQGEGDLLFLHTLIFADKKSMPPNTKAMTAQEALDKYPDFKYIFAGDNHKGFHYRSKDGRHVLVSGAMNTQASDQNETHYCYFVNTDKDIVEPIEIPDDC
jgi:DNA repair exonuclease SbcCD nuclease subunit